jgi:Coenzyme PQQ synthesis protein D (PqqD)
MGMLYSQSPSVEAAPLQEETILFHPEKKQFCVLNRSASFIWNQLATPTSADNVAAKLCESFSEVSLESALGDAHRTVQEMLTLNFIQPAN